MQKPSNDVKKTIPEAAEYLGLRPGTLEIWRWSGKGPAYLKLGRSVRYRLSDLEAFVEKSLHNAD